MVPVRCTVITIQRWDETLSHQLALAAICQPSWQHNTKKEWNPISPVGTYSYLPTFLTTLYKGRVKPYLTSWYLQLSANLPDNTIQRKSETLSHQLPPAAAYQLFGQHNANIRCKPSPLGKQFCMANTAIFTSYISFQSNWKKIFQPRQMWIYEILICAFRHD